MSQKWTTGAVANWCISLSDGQLPAGIIEITEERSYG